MSNICMNSGSDAKFDMNGLLGRKPLKNAEEKAGMYREGLQYGARPVHVRAEGGGGRLRVERSSEFSAGPRKFPVN